jgi:hypothetical protein
LTFSTTMASVVMSSDATEATFCRAERTTLVGSMTPDSKTSSNLSTRPLPARPRDRRASRWRNDAD